MTKRGYHPRAVNSGNSWSVTTPMAFMNFPLMTYIKEISPRPILFIHGEKAHSLYFSKTAYSLSYDDLTGECEKMIKELQTNADSLDGIGFALEQVKIQTVLVLWSRLATGFGK